MVRVKSLVAILTFGFISACSEPEYNSKYDPGGNIFVRAGQIEDLRKSDETFVIPKRCMSACTMYLALPNACLQPNGVLGFHSVSNQFTNSDAYIREANEFVAIYYPPRIAQWFLGDDGPSQSTEIVLVNNSELINRGEAKSCGTH